MLFARWRTPPPAKINDVAIYEDAADAWWNDASPVFAPLHAMTSARLAFLERESIDVQGKRVVDVGAGGGYVSVELAQRGANVVAIDLAPRALAAAKNEAQRRGLSIETLVASAEELPLASQCADVVVCTDVLVHVPNRAKAMDEIARLVAANGLLYVASMNRTWLARLVLITFGEDILGIIARGTHDPATFITPDEMVAEMSKRGLSVVAVEGVGPSGVNKRGLSFGKSMLKSVMYHALFRRTS